MISVSLKTALFVYVIVVSLSVFILFTWFRLKGFGAVVISLIIGQIVLNIIQMPIVIDFWSEMNSTVSLYSFIQLLTPLIVYVYALWSGMKHKRKEHVLVHHWA